MSASHSASDCHTNESNNQPVSYSAFDPNNLFPRQFDLDDGRQLVVHQSYVGDVGCVVWDAAIVLAKFIETLGLTSPSSGYSDDARSQMTEHEAKLAARCKSEFAACKAAGSKTKSVIELGSGTGFLGLLVASLGLDVTVTDLDEFVLLMEHNIMKNDTVINDAGGSCAAKVLKWGEEVMNDKADIVLLADCIYYEESLHPLVKTLNSLCGPESIVLCCHENRETEHKQRLQKKFFEEVGRTFTVTLIPQSLQHPEYRCDEILIHLFEPLTL